MKRLFILLLLTVGWQMVFAQDGALRTREQDLMTQIAQLEKEIAERKQSLRELEEEMMQLNPNSQNERERIEYGVRKALLPQIKEKIEERERKLAELKGQLNQLRDEEQKRLQEEARKKAAREKAAQDKKNAQTKKEAEKKANTERKAKEDAERKARRDAEMQAWQEQQARDQAERQARYDAAKADALNRSTPELQRKLERINNGAAYVRDKATQHEYRDLMAEQRGGRSVAPADMSRKPSTSVSQEAKEKPSLKDMMKNVQTGTPKEDPHLKEAERLQREVEKGINEYEAALKQLGL